MKKFYSISFCFLMVALLSLVGCGGGGGGSDYNYVAPTTNNPTPTAVPTAKVVPNVDLTAPEVQVQQAVVESIKTLENSFRLNVAPQTELRAATLPSGVPGFTGTQAMNLQNMMSYLLAALPTGGNIDSGVLIDRTDANAGSYQVATYTASTKTLEIAQIHSYFDYSSSPPIQKKFVEHTQKYIGCEATVSNGFMSSFKALAGTVCEAKDYNRDGTLRETVTITLVSGAEFELSQTLTAGNDTFVPWQEGSTYGYIIKSTGTEKVKISFTGPANFEVTLSNVDGTSGNGTVSLTGLTGTYEISSNIQVRQQVIKTGDTITPIVNTFAYKEWLEGETHNNQFAFANNQLNLGFSANYTNEKISLENGQIIMNNISKKAAAANQADANYSFSGGTGSMLVKYSGTDYAKFGYIYSLAISMTNLAFDIDNQNNAGNGTVIQIKKTNTDNSVNTLTYKIVDSKPVLQPGANNFAGGSETVKVDEAKGETTVEGKVNVATKTGATEAETLKIEFSSVKQNTGKIRVRVIITLGAAKKTMYFTRETTKAIADGHIYNGEVTADSGTTYGTFTVSNNGAGVLTLTADSSNKSFQIEN